MQTLAVVPIKHFSAAKQRLSEVLAGGARSSLVQAMFSDVLGALRRAEAVDSIAVVTDDISAEAIARRDGIAVLRDQPAAGQSEATGVGIRHAESGGFDRVALIPGDTPLLDPVELDSLLVSAERERIAVAIVPDRHGSGTNGLVISPPSAFPPAFGPGSLDRHVRAAEAAGIPYRTINVPSLAHDVDTAGDLAALWAVLDESRRSAQRTRGALTQLERTGIRAKVERAAPRADLTVEV